MHRLRILSLISFILLLLILPTSTVLAWNTIMHAQLSEIAFNHLPESVQQALTPYTRQIYDGAAAPDLYLRDWPNHELNIHGADNEKTPAVKRITKLYESIKLSLADPDIALSAIAYDMGLLSHYLADLNQPLHTDELPQEDLLHTVYETDVYLWQDKFVFSDKGSRFYFDPAQIATETAEQANRFYYPVYSAYLDKDGFDNSLGITWTSIQNTVADIRDTWLTLWLRSKSSQTSLALWTSQTIYHPGESIKILLSVLQGKDQSVEKSDLYIAATAPSGEIWFLNERSEFVQDSIPRYKKCFNTDSQIEIIKGLLWPESVMGNYKIHALLVKQNTDPTDLKNWLSDVVTSQFEVMELPEIYLNELNNELYLFPAIKPDSDHVTTIPLQRWDIIFLGEFEHHDYKENNVNALIPGGFDHILVYLGRDRYGTPYAVEMTHAVGYEIVDLRLLRLPEFNKVSAISETMALPIIDKPIWQYKNRWVKRLIPSELEKLLKNEKALLHSIERNWKNEFPYQLEFLWSGNLSDRQIHLVDDGFTNGASCTDYWLTLFEEVGAVCIHGARINAHELTDYYLNDPIASQTSIPDDLNPFSFNITGSKLLTSLNFKLIDPPAHVFSCDNTSETGVAIPSRLINSPQLEEITPVMEINNWP